MGIASRILNPIARRLGYAPAKPVRRSRVNSRSAWGGMAAGQITDLLADLVSMARSVDSDLSTLKRVQARSREICLNNSYGRQYLRLVRNNVIGPNGIRLQLKIKNQDGTLDTFANNVIETAWKKWGERGTATMDGRQSFIGIQRLAIESWARDGEVLIRKVRTRNNPFQFALQVFEADFLDFDLNKELPDGRICMGVEMDNWSRPRAYWMFETNPGDPHPRGGGSRTRRIPASEIIHLFISERPGQTRGIPPMVAAIKNLNMLGKYEESEAIAARIAAAKMGFFTSEEGESGFTGDDRDELGNIIDEIEPGTFHRLPAGDDIKMFDPQHPNSNFAGFVKALLRGLASGLGVSYNALASDLEGVNYSSLRAGDLKERDAWRDLQNWFIEDFCREVFSRGEVNWLRQSLDFGALTPLDEAREDKYNASTWHPRGWQWVDPAKEVKANTDAIAAKLKTYTSCLAEQGIDLEEHLRAIKAEQDLANELGVKLEIPGTQALPPADAGDGATEQDPTQGQGDE